MQNLGNIMPQREYPQFKFDAAKVVIYGGGGLSKMIIETVRAMHIFEITGIIDDGLPPGTDVIGSQVLGGADMLPDMQSVGIHMAVNAVGGIGDFRLRLKVFKTLANAGFVCPPIVHPTAYIDPSAELQAGVLVLAQSYVSGNAKIGQGSLINNSVVVSHDCILGECTNLSPGVMLAGDVVIKDFTQIGMNATVNIGITVGQKCRIGNGATVKQNVPDNTSIYAGAIWPEYKPKKDKSVTI